MTHIRERVESIADQILALSEQSQQIGEIIATVGDLADQSNMLALNAAIWHNWAVGAAVKRSLIAYDH